ncbi:MAG: hypothetical protein JWP01_2372 [Myxococcales bacterium]|nr:hypothetical protein [Myxococcales bacterium]
MKRAILVCAALAGCGRSTSSTPDAAAICRGTQEPRDAIVLRASDPAAGGKARGLRESAMRSQGGKAVAELDRFIEDHSTQVMFEAHLAERDRKLAEDLELAHVMVSVLISQHQTLEIVDASPTGDKVAELMKPLLDGNAVGAVRTRATALATAIADLAARSAAVQGATDVKAARLQVAEAIKVANVAHAQLNEAIARMHATAVSLAALADEQGKPTYGLLVRLWTRLTAIRARLDDPWPASVIAPHTSAVLVSSPRQWIVTCSAAPPPPRAAQLAGAAAITDGRDTVAATLGLGPRTSPVKPPSLEALRFALAPPKP